MTDILDIACDESGHTGPDLLQRHQRYFAYASVAISDAEAFDIIQKARTLHPVQMPELKGQALMSSGRGRKLIATLLSEAEDRYIVNVHDKLLALCGWLFEYIYEPVYQDNPKLLYRKNLHRFVAMYTWLWMTDNESQARLTIEQFQAYMRSREPSDAPLLFDNPRPPLSDDVSEHPFESILRFAYGYRDIIIADNSRLDKALPDGGRWTLDLSTSALWSHLNYWGTKGKPLSVRCDASKPLQANINNFWGDDNNPGIHRARQYHDLERFGWRLLEPIAFGDSRNHPAIQLADVIAGTIVYIFSNESPPETQEIMEMLQSHMYAHSILPDLDVVDPATQPAAVNAFILYDMAKRAERRSDPYENLEKMYRMAELSWAKGRI